MTPPHDHPGAISTGIDIAIVAVILGCLGVLLLSAWRLLAGAVRAVARRKRRDGGREQ